MEKVVLKILFWLSVFSASVNSFGQTWLQKGTNIYGQAAEDYCGEAVAISGDGSTIIMGSVGNDQAGSNAGNARIFKWNGTTWLQMGIDLTGDFTEDAAGSSVAINYDGSIVVVGLAGYDTPFNSGQARIYEWNGTTWVLKGSPINGEVSNSYSGRSVSMSDDGNRVAIGARYNSENGSNTGQVEVYDWNGADWIQAGVDLNGDSNGDWFGEPVVLSADGNVLAVGATQTFGIPPQLGYVKIYEWDGSNWLQKGATIFGTVNFDLSADAIALSYSGDTLAIGSMYNDDNGNDAGHVRTFYWNGSSWVQLGSTLVGSNPDSHLGSSLSISSDGTRLAVGAYGVNNNTGQLTVFEYSGSDWVQLGNFMNGSAINNYSSMNDMTNNGDALIVSELGNDIFATNAGRIQVYEFCAPTYSTQFINDCDSYTVPSGNQTYVTSGTFTDIISNTKGCDSVMTINLNLNFSSSSTINPIACFSYNSPAGNVYASSGTYTEVITNNAGCDSTILIQLVVNNFSASTIIQGDSLLASPTGLSYQWFDCNQNEVIAGATQPFYNPTLAGDYAVIIENNFGCVDTSDCQLLNLSYLFWDQTEIMFYPNPVAESITLVGLPLNSEVIVYDVKGQDIMFYKVENGQIIIDMTPIASGNYTLAVEYLHERFSFVVVKI